MKTYMTHMTHPNNLVSVMDVTKTTGITSQVEFTSVRAQGSMVAFLGFSESSNPLYTVANILMF